MMQNKFTLRLKNMLMADFKRLYSSPLLYIFAFICFIVPILILTMTRMNESPEGGMSFTNTWQMIGSLPNTSSDNPMDMSAMLNINLLLFAVGILTCIFVNNDFSSGFIKNYLTVRKNKTDYVLSKIIVLLSGSCVLFILFLLGTIFGGAFASLSFATDGFNAFNIIASIFSKIFVSSIFISIFVVISLVAKDKLWLSILLSLGLGMILFMMVPMITPLNAGFMNIILTIAGMFAFAIPLSLLGNVILNKTKIV